MGNVRWYGRSMSTPWLARLVVTMAAVSLAACSAGNGDDAEDDRTGDVGASTTVVDGPDGDGTGVGGRDDDDAAHPSDVAAAWARQLTGPTSEDEIDGVAAAPDGGAWITGKFELTTSVAGTTLTSAGAADAPLARFDADGEPLWVVRVGGVGEDNFFDIDADDAGAVATGWFEGSVELGPVTLTSAGSRDCVIAAFSDDGDVRWATSLGGPGPDGCNEVTIGPDGSVVTSVDTTGGWDSPAGTLPVLPERDTILLRLSGDGQVEWGRRVGGRGSQRSKALAVADDGSIAVGGDTDGDLEVDGERVEMRGSRADAWLSEWSPEGELRWATSWGGPGEDLAKGVAFGDGGWHVVGAFAGTVQLGSVALDAGEEPDLAVARFDRTGEAVWATSVSATGRVVGTEVVASGRGGVLFGVNGVAGGLEARPVDGDPVVPGDGVAMVEYGPDGSVGMAADVPGTTDAATAIPGEIGRVGERVYLDIVIRGSGNTVDGRPLEATRKDGSLWALDLRPAQGSAGP